MTRSDGCGRMDAWVWYRYFDGQIRASPTRGVVGLLLEYRKIQRTQRHQRHQNCQIRQTAGPRYEVPIPHYGQAATYTA